MFQYDEYSDEMSNSLSKDEFYTLKELYKGITQGTEDNPSDELNYLNFQWYMKEELQEIPNIAFQLSILLKKYL